VRFRSGHWGILLGVEPGWDLGHAAFVTAVALLAAGIVILVVHLLARRLRRWDPVLASLPGRARHPFRALTVVIALLVARPEEGASPETADRFRHTLVLLLIAVGAWLLARLALVAQEAALRNQDLSVPDNLRVRRLHTQVILLRRITVAVIAVTAVAAMLLTFASVRTIGASLLASAGVVGIVVGLAAQTTLSNVFAGLQLAFSDELRLDDVVVVEQEWGRVEELTLTYVVIRLWDERRLVLPTTYFTQTPFQNWTRHESRVIGSVLLHVDYSLPVAPLRQELQRVLEESPLWDRREWVLQVVDTTPTTMVLRALMSSADAPSNWDLRCDVRERLLAFLAGHYPEQLPRIRADVPPAAILDAPDGRAQDRPPDRPKDRPRNQARDQPRPDPGRA
jgi:small-conductance mechanosensitive channel